MGERRDGWSIGWGGVGEGKIAKGCIVCPPTEVVGAWCYQRSPRCTTTGIVVGDIRHTTTGTIASTTIGIATTREAKGISRFGGLDECHGCLDG